VDIHCHLGIHRQLPAPEHGGLAKALWFLFIIFVPIIGVVAYLIARPPAADLVDVR